MHETDVVPARRVNVRINGLCNRSIVQPIRVDWERGDGHESAYDAYDGEREAAADGALSTGHYN